MPDEEWEAFQAEINREGATLKERGQASAKKK
jgi:hypothetical protein